VVRFVVGLLETFPMLTLLDFTDADADPDSAPRVGPRKLTNKMLSCVFCGDTKRNVTEWHISQWITLKYVTKWSVIKKTVHSDKTVYVQ
jgi:hypothetical protein